MHRIEGIAYTLLAAGLIWTIITLGGCTPAPLAPDRDVPAADVPDSLLPGRTW